VLKGELIEGDGNRYGAGTHMMLDWGDMFGPWEAGPEGAVLYCVIMGTGRFFGGDFGGWRRLLAEKGAVNEDLPRPPSPPFADSGISDPALNWGVPRIARSPTAAIRAKCSCDPDGHISPSRR